MSGRIEKTVFISYRRTNIAWALAIYQSLRIRGYDVFFDFQNINSGDFEQVILGNVKGRAHFLVLLTPPALERCKNPGDWLRREIETAIDEKRNIIPVFLEGFSFGDPMVAQYLTGKLEELKKYNGINIPYDYFNESMEKLNSRFLRVPLDTVLHPISNTVQTIVREQQAAADKAQSPIFPNDNSFITTNDNQSEVEIKSIDTKNIYPRVFISYPSQDREFVEKLSRDLQASLINVTYRNWEIRSNESLIERMEEQGLGECDLFVVYLTLNSINSEWCARELNELTIQQIETRGVTLQVFADSDITLENAPDDIKSLRIPILNGQHYGRSLGQLISLAWESLQTRRRLIDPHNYILCGVNILESPYRRTEFVKEVKQSLIVAGPNLRGWLTEEARSGLIEVIRKAPHIQVKMILGTPEILTALNGGYGTGTEHLKESVADLNWIVSQLSEEEKKRFQAYFHFGAATLSAVIRDPDTEDGVLLFTPRWGIDYIALRRMYCVIDKKTNPEQFNAISSGTFNLIQSDALTLDKMTIRVNNT